MQAEISGASIRKVGGRPYVVVDPRLMFQDGPPTIHGIAQRLMLADAAVFSSLLDNALNAHALRKLWADNVGTCDDAPAPRDLAALRTALKIAGTTFTADDDRFPNGTRTPYVGWTVDAAKPLVFPRTAAFVKLQRLERERRARQERFQALEADFSRLERMRREIHGTAQDLYEGVIKYYDEFMKPIGADVALAIGADELIATLLEFPEAPPSQGDRRAMEDLKARTARLVREAIQHVLTEPPDEFLFGFAGKRRTLANQLLSQVHDPVLVTEVRLLVANADVAPPSLLSELCETLVLAYRCLALTERSTDVAEDCRQVIDIVASGRFDASDLESPKNPVLAGLVKLEFMPPEGTNVASIIASLLTTGTQAVGELPGPASLATCLAELGGMLAAPKIMSNPAAARALSARLYRFLVNCAGLSRAQRVDLFLAVDAGDLGAIAKVKWTSRFMTGPGWSGAMAIANLAAFFLIAREGAPDLDALGNMIGTAIGGGLGIVQAFGHWSAASKALASGRGAAVLGTVGSVVMVAAAAYTVKKDLDIGDETGAWIHGAGAVGGAFSAGGFIVAGAASSATVFGAPLGVVLMAVGAVIGIASGAIDIYRSVAEPSPKGYFRALLEAFSKTRAYREVAPARPALAKAFETVNARRGIDFWELTPAAAGRLRDAGFRETDVQRLVG